MTTYVVTGGAGFIGSHIVEALLRRGDTVRIVDNFSTGKPSNIEAFRRHAELFSVDIAESGKLKDAFHGVDYVIHQAAIASVPKSTLDPLGTNRVNLEGTLNVLVAARAAGVRRVVFASSSAVYGDGPELPKREDMPPDPLSPYGAQKLFGETYCRIFARSFGLETVALRYFNVFGPRQDPASEYSGVLAKFIPAVLEDRRPVIYGDGNQSRDFIYVSNVVDANLLACAAPAVSGDVFNVASGSAVSITAMLQAINQSTGKNVEAIHSGPRTGDILHSCADVSRARQGLGYQAGISFQEGLKHTIEWYRGNPA